MASNKKKNPWRGRVMGTACLFLYTTSSKYCWLYLLHPIGVSSPKLEERKQDVE